jgi:hypothetical protein
MGLLSRTLGMIWNVLLKNKKEVLLEKLENDPDYQKNLAELEKLQKERDARLEKKRATSAEFRANEKEYLSFFDE